MVLDEWNLPRSQDELKRLQDEQIRIEADRPLPYHLVYLAPMMLGLGREMATFEVPAHI